MRLEIVPCIFTILMFGLSIFLWIPMNGIRLVPETPLYLTHPLFTLELVSLLSTVIAWVIAALISVYNLVRKGLSITSSITQNRLVVSLAFITILVAISGSLFFYLEVVPKYPVRNTDRYVTPGAIPSPLRPFAVSYGFGVLFCEGAWIVEGMLRVSSFLRSSQKNKARKKSRSVLTFYLRL